MNVGVFEQSYFKFDMRHILKCAGRFSVTWVLVMFSCEDVMCCAVYVGDGLPNDYVCVLFLGDGFKCRSRRIIR